MSKSEGEVVNYEGNFLVHKFAKYIDNKGNRRTWEFVSRKNSQKAVLIIAKLINSNKYVLVKQYRAPVDAICVEFPAGLIDNNECPDQTAIRELDEETGYVGVPKDNTPFVFSSAGMTDESSSLVTINIDELSEENECPRQHLEGEEDIKVVLVKEHNLYQYLLNCAANGEKVDSRLMAFAIGINQKYSLSKSLKDMWSSLKSLF